MYALEFEMADKNHFQVIYRLMFTFSSNEGTFISRTKRNSLIVLMNRSMRFYLIFSHFTRQILIYLLFVSCPNRFEKSYFSSKAIGQCFNYLCHRLVKAISQTFIIVFH